MPGRKYSDAQLHQMADMREAGSSYREIARVMGMSSSAVSWHCLRLAADRPDAKPLGPRARGPQSMSRGSHTVRRFTASEDELLIVMDLAGARVCDIARALGRRSNSVRGRLMTLARHDARLEAA